MNALIESTFDAFTNLSVISAYNGEVRVISDFNISNLTYSTKLYLLWLPALSQSRSSVIPH